MDWALVLIAVSAGYLPPSEVIDFASRTLEEDSPQSICNLAILAFEPNPDAAREEKDIACIAAGISKDEWSAAFEKLFYAVACWMYVDCVDEYTPFRYDLSVDLHRLWEALGHPRIGEHLFGYNEGEREFPEGVLGSLEIPWSARCEPLWKQFVAEGKARFQPKHAFTEASIKTNTDWNVANGMPFIIPTPFIAEPMNFFVAGEDPMMKQLQHQYYASNIVREMCNSEGFVVEFAISSGVEPLTDCKPSFAIGDVFADSDGGSVGFVMTVKDGYLHSLEAYTLAFTLDGRGWPPSGSAFDDVHYYLYTHELSEREWDRIRPNWQLETSS